MAIHFGAEFFLKMSNSSAWQGVVAQAFTTASEERDEDILSLCKLKDCLSPFLKQFVVPKLFNYFLHSCFYSLFAKNNVHARLVLSAN